MTQQTPPGWYADPSGQPQQRYWDGQQWTSHTHPGAGNIPQQRTDSSKLEQIAELNVDGGHSPEKIQKQVGGVTSGAGGGTIFTEPVLVVNQKAKLVEVNTEYGVYSQQGNQIGTIVQVEQSALAKVVRFLGEYDQYMKHVLEIRDAHGQPMLKVTRPAKFLKSKVIVQRPDGTTVGEIVQQNVLGKKKFAIMANDQQIGEIRGEDWFSFELGLFDHTDSEVARITKTFEGFGKMLFTTADNYVLKLHRQLPDPLLSMVVASALTIDLAIHQDDR
ncbi:MAG TPA: DUF2510 domain-containing protein [Candidatus Stackebrandtia faecavium]|nr:DUF2510 domain-containing protein [Candidatus Stackebrandtia faecavium]